MLAEKGAFVNFAYCLLSYGLSCYRAGQWPAHQCTKILPVKLTYNLFWVRYIVPVLRDSQCGSQIIIIIIAKRA